MYQKRREPLIGFGKPALALLSVVLIFSGIAFNLFQPTDRAVAAPNEAINFQAKLMNASGAIAPDGFYNVEFKLYDAASGGTLLWTDTYIDTNGATAGNDNRIRVENGYLTVSLGSQAGNGFPNTINWDEQLWITMNIGGTIQTATPTWDGEMNPRLRLTAVPYAFRANQLANTNGSNTSVLQFATFGQDTVITLPDPGAGTATVCYQGSANCGFVTGAATDYIQNQNASSQTTANFWISGTGRADSSILTPTVDTATAVALNIGASGGPTATVINLNQNTSVASGKTLTVAGGATSLTGATTGDALTVSNSTSTGNVAVFKDNNTAVLTIADGGGSTFTTTVDTSNALRVVNSAGGTVMSVSTSGGTPLTLGRSGTVGSLGSVLSTTYEGSSSSNRTFTYTGSVAAGQSVVGSLVLSAGAIPTATITDSKGNTYTVDASVTTGSSATTYIFSSNITTGIVPGDTLTIGLSAGTGRWLVSVQGFGNLLTPALDRTATNTDNGTSMTTGTTLATTAADELVFAAFGFNAGRTFTPDTGSGFTGIPQISTATGSNDRSLGAQWKYVTATGTQTANATLSSAGAYAAAIATYKSSDPDILGLAGAISLSDGGPSNYASVLGTNALTGSRTLLLPDESGTLCVQGSASCGFVTGSSSNFIQNGTTVQASANFNIRSAATGSVGAVIQGANGQTADLLQLQTYNGSSSTNVFAVSAAGVATLAGGQTIDVTTASAATANGLTLQPGISTAATATGGAIAVKGGDVSGTTTVTGGAVTIQGGNATGGSGSRTGGSVIIDGGTGATAAGAISIGTANSTSISIGSVGSTAKATTINIGTTSSTTAGAIQTVTIGSNSNLAHTTVIQGGNSNTAGSEAIRIVPQTTGGVAIGSTTGTGTITLGQSTASNTINIGNADFTAANTQAINIASGTQTTAASTLNVNILSGAAGSAGTAQLNLANSDRVTQVDIGNVVADAARTLNMFTGNSTTVDTINIGTGATTVAGGKTINIGNGTPTGSGTNLISIGSTTNASSTTIQGGTGSSAVSVQAGTSGTISVGTANANTIAIGTGSASGSVVTVNGGTGAGNNITLQTNNASSGVLIKSATNSSSAFTVQDASNNSFLGIDTSGGAIAIGYASSTTTLNGTTKLATLGASTANAVAVCRDSATTNLIACDANTSGAPFIQGGNTFGATAVLGTNDSNSLQLETNNIVRATFDTSNALYLGNGVTAATPNNFTVASTGSSTAGTAGANLTLQGGAGASATTGSAGGSVTISGGNAAGSGNNAGGNVLLQGGTATSAGTVGAVIVRAQTNGSSTFMIQNSSSSSMFIADTQNGRVGINLGSTTAPASTLEVNGTIRISGTTTENFTTPGSNTASTKIHIPLFDPGAAGQIIALGLGSGAQSTARGIALYDGRTGAHAPTVAVLSPNESQTFGLSWEGSNSASYVKTSGTSLVLQASNTDIVTASTTGTSIGTSLSVFGNSSVTGNGTFGAAGNYGIVTLLMQSQDNFSSGLRVQKRGNAGDINGSVASGAEIGYHEFYGWDGSAYGRGAYVITRSTEAWNGTSHGASYSIATTRNGTTSNSEVMILGHDGAAVFRNSANSSSAFQVQNALGTSTILAVDTSANRIGINTNSSAPTADLSFGEGADRTINVITRASNAAGRSLTIQGGAGGAGASANQGGALNLQGGAGGGTNGNGGNVNITGGTGTGTGVQGLVVISTPTFTTATTQSCGTNCTITQANVDSNGAVVVNATAAGLNVTLPDPTITTAGRIVYVTAANASNDFTLLVNGGGTGNQIAMRQNTTATMIWNGSDWTAAGASSSTTLQAAYDNTLSSAGGAEIVLNNTATSDGMTIRNNPTTPLTGGILEVQSAIGTNLFSVNDSSAALEFAANGGAETSGTFSTNWTGAPAGGSVSRNTSTANLATGQGSVQVVTTAANHGVRNNLTSNLAVSSTFQVSFTIKLSSGTMASSLLEVVYSRNGGTNTVPCSHISQTFSSTTWAKVTCEFGTDGTSASNPDLIIRQTDGTGRTFYIDNLSVTRANTTDVPSNVQIGGGINGGPITLFTLDRSSTPPVENGNQTYLGSMYYDTTTGRIQCYEADGWGACGSSPDNIITLTPEYTGAVLNGTGVGTMTADFCADQAGVLTVDPGNLCASGEARNYYKWTSPQASQQTYSIYVTYKLPSTFKTFADDNTITLTAQRSDSNAAVTYEVYKSTGSAITACGTETTVTTADDTWQTVSINGNEASSCAFAGSNYVIFKINVKAEDNANAYVENLNFTYTNN